MTTEKMNLSQSLRLSWKQTTEGRPKIAQNTLITETFQMVTMELASPTSVNRPNSPEELKMMFREALNVKAEESGTSPTMVEKVAKFLDSLVDHAVEAHGYHLPDVTPDELSAKEMYDVPITFDPSELS